MKKTISMMLIVAMLLSMIVALPMGTSAAVNNGASAQSSTNVDFAVNAGTDMTKWPEQAGAAAITDPTYSNVGNTVVSKTDAAYKAALAAEGYIPIVNAKGEGKPENAKLFSEVRGTAGNYYLYEDITTSGMGGKPTGFVLDGCGHTITLSDSLFENPKNTTLKNITITGKIDCIKIFNGGGFTILGRWGCSGWLKAYNLTLDVDVVTNNKSGSQFGGTLASIVNTGSVIENVVNTGTFTFEERTDTEAPQIISIGGIVGEAIGTTFKNVVNKGAITIGDGTNALSLNVTNGAIGGIAGNANKNNSFENCFNEGAITIKDKAVINNNLYVGGIAGKMGATPSGVTSAFKNCVNSGAISISADTANAAMRTHIGGIAGYVTTAVNFDTCVNKGAISTAKTVIPTDGNDPVGTLGGITGYVTGVANYNKCKNDAPLSNSVDKYNIGGIAGWIEGNKTFTNCINTANGDISMTWEAANMAGAAGIIGYSKTGTVTFTHCENNGDIKLVKGGGNNLYIGGIMGRHVNAMTTITYSKNTGAIEGSTYAKGFNTAGGLISGTQYNTSATTNNVIDISYSVNNGPVKAYIAGGIMGGLNNDKNEQVAGVKISNCVNDVNGAVTAIVIAGGIAGSNTRDTGLMGGAVYDIDNCVNKGTVTCSADTAGGILGYTKLAFDLDNCLNTGAINAQWAGGMIGYLKAGSDANISGCESNAIITGSKCAGAIIAYTEANATITDCENAGGKVIENAASANGGDIGGIVGCVEKVLRMSNCANRAAIVNKKDGGTNIAKFVGGLVGRALGGLYINTNDDGSVIADTICVNYGTVESATFASGNTQYVGGIVGLTKMGGYVANAINEATATVKAYENGQGGCSGLGGIVGVPSDGSYAITIINSHNKAEITSNGYNNYAVGGILGRAFSSHAGTTIIGCSNSGNITGYKYASGIAAFLEGGNASFENCTNTGNVTALWSVGGILAAVGVNGGTAYSATFKNCVNGEQGTTKAKIENTDGNGSDHGTGGIAGYVQGDAIFEGVTNYAEVTSSATKDKAAKYMGGLLGISRGKIYAGYTVASAKTDNRVKGATCYNYGQVTVKGIFNNDHVNPVGGLFGHGIKGGYISNCENHGDIVVTGTHPFEKTTQSSIGGIVGTPGNNAGASTVIENCKNYGDIYNAKNNGADLVKWTVGGILGSPDFGQAAPVEVKNCENYGNITGFYVAGGICGRTWSGRISFNNCKNAGTISNSLVYDEVVAKNVAVTYGGILGYADTATAFVDCTNNGAINITAAAATAGYVGGIVGRTMKDAALTNCHNTAAITASAERYHIGGLVGCFETSTHSIVKSSNSGTVTAFKGTGGTMQGIGGIIGYANGGYLDVLHTVNNAAVVLNGAGKDTRVGGIIGRVANQCVLNVNYVINNGDVTAPEATQAGNNVGGIIGNVQTWNQSSYAINIYNTVNNGKVQGVVAGGFVGYGYPDSDSGKYYVGINISDSVNNGEVIGTNNAGAFVGATSRATTEVTIENSANAGKISGKNAGVVLGATSGFSGSITNVANIGKIEGTSATYDFADYGFASDCASTTTDPLDKVLFVLENSEVAAFDVSALEFAIAKAETIIAEKNKNNYVEDTWNLMVEKLDAAKTYYNEKDLANFDAANSLVFNGSNVTIYTQAEIVVVQKALTDAYNDLWLISELVGKVKDMLTIAEVFEADYYAGKVLYTADSWDAFVKAIGALRVAATYGEDLSWEIAKPAMANMTAAQDGLVKGGDIYSAEDFYAIDGMEGTFYLKANITINKALKELKATIVGGGKTITLDACAIAGKTSANVTDLKVVGTAGDAASIFGTISGTVNLKGMIINVEALAEAVISDNVASGSNVKIYDIVALVDAPYVITNVKALNAEMYGVLLMGEGVKDITDDEDVEVTVSYADGKVFYGEKKTDIIKDKDVFASGAVTFVINANFNEYAEDYNIAEFNGIILTQKLGTDKLPTTAPANIDGTNVVVEDGRGGYRNKYLALVGPSVGTPDGEETPVVIDLGGLKAAIDAAKALDASKYTEASFNVVKSYIAAAELALNAKDQLTVDIATEALNDAVAALTEKPAEEPAVELDFTKLDEAIAKAEALKADDYSEGTWSALQTMLALAKAAKTATNQNKIDQAVAGLNSAIESLKAPVVDEPVADDKDDDKADETPADEGCGSVVGGAAVVAVAVLALGAGVTFKKKED